MAEPRVDLIKGPDRIQELSSNHSVYNFQITRSGDTSVTSTVGWFVSGTGASPVDGGDFEFGAFPAGSVTFAAGETMKYASFRVVGDRTFEPDESFLVSLRNPTGAVIGLGQVTGVIRNDDPSPPTGNDPGQVINSPGPGSLLVGTGGPDTFNASSGPDEIHTGEGADLLRWATAPWSPAQVMDFKVGVDRLDFSQLLQAAGYQGSDPVGDGYISLGSVGQSATRVYFDADAGGPNPQWPINVAVLHGVPEQGLTWAQLSQGGGSPPPATVGFTGGSIGIAEGDSGVRIVNFTVGRYGDTSGQTTVNFAVSGSGSAPADNADFYGGAQFGTISFMPGETARTVPVQIAGDTFTEPDETYTVTLSGVQGGRIGVATATGTISNDDAGTPPPPAGGRVINSPGPGSTLTGGAGDDTLNASRGSDLLTGGAGRDVFAWAAEPWSPARVTDFVVGTDRLDLSRLFQTFGYSGTDPMADRWISFVDDGAGGTKVLFDHDGAGPNPQWPNYIIQLEKVSTAGLTWSQLSGGSTPPPQPGASQVSIYGTRSDLSETAAAANGFAFTIARNGDLSVGATVSWSIAGAGTSPASGADFPGGSFPTGGVTFAPGENSKIFAVNLANDTTAEADETFAISITGTTYGTVGIGSVTATIRDDDATSPPPPDGGGVINSSRYGDTLTGGSGADTLNAGRGPDQLTGAGGADRFVYGQLPWNAGHVTDFTPGTDVLDLRPLFQAAGYSGTNPIADRQLEFRPDGAGNTQVYFDRDAPHTGDWPFLITTLDGVWPAEIRAGDWLFR